jgi:uncharacterized membrane protein YsdA (DUF1294 family)
MYVLLSLGFALGVPALITFLYAGAVQAAPLPLWLLCINLMLFALMGKDKLAAKNKGARTPELTLLALTFVGGTLAFFAGRHVFKHKKSKEQFNHALYAVLGAQAFCAWYFWPQLWALV